MQQTRSPDSDFAQEQEMLRQGRRKAAIRAVLTRSDHQAAAFLDGLPPDAGGHGCILAERLRFGPPETWRGWMPGSGRVSVKMWPDPAFTPKAPTGPGWAGIAAVGPGFLVQHWIDGPSLAQAAAAGLESEILKTAADAVAAFIRRLHAAGFAHGDVGPANIILRAADHAPVLVDWGETGADIEGWSGSGDAFARDRRGVERLLSIAAAAANKS